MTPKEEAKKLVDKFYQTTPNEAWYCPPVGSITSSNYSAWEQAKHCALIAVDEIIKNQPRYPSNVDWDDCGATHKYYYEEQRAEAKKYWQDVRTEIESP